MNCGGENGACSVGEYDCPACLTEGWRLCGYGVKRIQILLPGGCIGPSPKSYFASPDLIPCVITDRLVLFSAYWFGMLQYPCMDFPHFKCDD